LFIEIYIYIYNILWTTSNLFLKVKKLRGLSQQCDSKKQILVDKKSFTAPESNANSRIFSLQSNTNSEAVEENDRLQKHVRDLKDDVILLRQEVKSEKERADRAHLQIDSLSSRDKVYRDTATRLAKVEFENQQLKAQLSASEENEKLLRAYREEVQQMDMMRKRYLAAQQELRTLKDQEMKTVKLESQVASYRTREKEWETAIMDKERATYEVAYLKKQNEAWLQAFKRFFPSVTTTPAMAIQALSQLNKSHAALLKEKNEAVSSAQEAIRMQEQAVHEVTNLKKEIDKLKEMKYLTESRLQQTQVELVSVKRERDSTNELLNHYELEDLKKPSLSKDFENATDSPNITSPNLSRMKRIQTLENQLKNLREINQKLREEKVSVEASRAEARSAEAQLRRVENMLEKSEREVAVLRSKLGRGDYDKATTKVLHLAMNPSNAALQAKKRREQDKLRNTIKTLEAKIVAYEEQFANLSSLNNGPRTGALGVDALNAARKRAEMLEDAQRNQIALRSEVEKWKIEADKMKKEAEEGSTRMERLKTVFRKRVSEFREACYCMTGFKIELIDGDKYRLRPMYAGSEEEVVIIQFKNGNLTVLATDFVQSLDEETRALLGRFHSVPAFLSQITLDLFNQTTMMKG